MLVWSLTWPLHAFALWIDIDLGGLRPSSIDFIVGHSMLMIGGAAKAAVGMLYFMAHAQNRHRVARNWLNVFALLQSAFAVAWAALAIRWLAFADPGSRSESIWFAIACAVSVAVAAVAWRGLHATRWRDRWTRSHRDHRNNDSQGDQDAAAITGNDSPTGPDGGTVDERSQRLSERHRNRNHESEDSRRAFAGFFAVLLHGLVFLVPIGWFMGAAWPDPSPPSDPVEASWLWSAAFLFGALGTVLALVAVLVLLMQFALHLANMQYWRRGLSGVAHGLVLSEALSFGAATACLLLVDHERQGSPASALLFATAVATACLALTRHARGPVPKPAE